MIPLSLICLSGFVVRYSLISASTYFRIAVRLEKYRNLRYGNRVPAYPLDRGDFQEGATMPRRNFLITLAYDGSGFSGWQRLPDPERTVQREVERALGSVLGEDLEVTGAGRTDAGVHAEGQAASFHSRTTLDCPELVDALRTALPDGIRCTGIREVDPRFHARYRAKSKTYRYRLHVATRADPEVIGTSLHVDGPLDLESLKEAAALFEGEHDFRAFTNAPKSASTKSRIDSVRVLASGDFIDIYFRAPGFLYNQVRIMAGALVAVAKGKSRPRDLARLLESGNRADAPGMAGAFGLSLVSVEF